MRWQLALMAVCAVVLIGGPVAVGQQAPQQTQDPEFMKQALIAVQVQRNQAFDAMAACQAHDQMSMDELKKAKDRIAELEKAVAEKSKTQ